jgi:hypothetical protein
MFCSFQYQCSGRLSWYCGTVEVHVQLELLSVVDSSSGLLVLLLDHSSRLSPRVSVAGFSAMSSSTNCVSGIRVGAHRRADADQIEKWTVEFYRFRYVGVGSWECLVIVKLGSMAFGGSQLGIVVCRGLLKSVLVVWSKRTG